MKIKPIKITNIMIVESLIRQFQRFYNQQITKWDYQDVDIKHRGWRLKNSKKNKFILTFYRKNKIVTSFHYHYVGKRIIAKDIISNY